MAVTIHPTAVVDPSAQLADGVLVGPFASIGPDVTLGEGCEILTHAVIHRNTIMGRENRVFSGASVGGDPQDLKYKGERSWLHVGDRNTIRECVTLNRGVGLDGKTLIGSDNLLMAYSHVAHDCVVGDHVVIVNAVALAGHVTVEDHAFLGGMCAVHQFARIGGYAMVGGGAMLSKDVCPYTTISGDIPQMYGLNLVGLRRAGFTREQIHALDEAYKILFRSSMNTNQALEQLAALPQKTPQVEHLLAFVKASQRGIHK
jgi:UDP-N-acetylglucosamine acyltransferase